MYSTHPHWDILLHCSITGCCCNAQAIINRMGNLTPFKIMTPFNIVTPENFILKLSHMTMSGDYPPHKFWFQLVQWGPLPKYVEYYHFVTFFDCPVLSCPYLFSLSHAQGKPLDRFSHFMVKRRVSMQGCAFWGIRLCGKFL